MRDEERIIFTNARGEPVWHRSFTAAELEARRGEAQDRAYADMYEEWADFSGVPTTAEPEPEPRLTAEAERLLADPSTQRCLNPRTLDDIAECYRPDETVRAYVEAEGGWQAEARRTIAQADALHEANMAAIGERPEPQAEPPAVTEEDVLFERLKEATGIR